MNRLLIDDPGDELPQCGCCQYPVPASDLLECKVWQSEETEWLCTLCRNSYAGNTVVTPGSHSENAGVLQHQCFLTNAILDQLGAFKENLEVL